MNVDTGVEPFDERYAGLRRGGTYLLTGGADAAKFVFMLQFLDAGLRRGETVALLSATARDDVLEQGDHFGFSLREHWHGGRCNLLGFKDEYPRRLVHAAEPIEAFDELRRLVDGPVTRIAVDPGSFLWSPREGSELAAGFCDWAERCDATVVASVAAGLSDRPDPATEWVVQRATGTVGFVRLSSGLIEVEPGRFTPPVVSNGPVTLELRSGAGLVGPSGRVERRREDRVESADGPLTLLELGAGAPADLVAWMTRDRGVERCEDGSALLDRLSGEPVGLVAVYVARETTDEAVEILRSARPLTSAPMLLLSDHALRSGDRTAALDAGADDVLSGGIDLKELDARIRRARESARRDTAVDPAPAPRPAPGLLDAAEFAHLLDGRLASPEGELFSLLRFDIPEIPDLGSVLASGVRSDSGDLVGPIGNGFGVVLQDARAQQAQAYLRRVRTELRLRGYSVPLEAEILSSPEQADEIRRLARDAAPTR